MLTIDVFIYLSFNHAWPKSVSLMLNFHVGIFSIHLNCILTEVTLKLPLPLPCIVYCTLVHTKHS